MAINNFKPGGGKFASGSKFKGRNAGGDSNSNRSFNDSRNSNADRPAREGAGGRPEKAGPGGEGKKIFNRSERFTRSGESGAPRGGDRPRSFERSSFKSGPKFDKGASFQGRQNEGDDSQDGSRPRYGDRKQGEGNYAARGERRPAPTGDRKPYGAKPYQKSYGAEERRETRPAYDKPRFDKGGDRDKPRFDKGRDNDRPRFDKGGDRDKPRFDKGRDNDRPRFDKGGDRDKPRFEKGGDYDKPRFDKGGDYDKPRFDKGGDRDRPRFEKGGDYDKPRFDKSRETGERTEDRPFKRTRPESFDRNRGGQDRAGGREEKRSFRSKSEEPKEAPNYDLKRYQAREHRNVEKKDANGLIRLNRYIANAGICSRREADTLIASGEIKVNGEVITEMGYMVRPEDTVTYGKKRLNREKMVYVLLNKPKDFITTTEDPEGRKTVMDLVGKASKERIFPVGRLDRNTTGLLLFTNDGELAHKLTHPSNNVSKIYQVELDKPITRDHFEMIVNGLELEDGKADVDDLAIIGDTNTFLGIQIHIGKNRIVRRIFEHLGYEVVSLDRVQYAGLTKKDLPRGSWRFLNEKEVIRLKYFL